MVSHFYTVQFFPNVLTETKVFVSMHFSTTRFFFTCFYNVVMNNQNDFISLKNLENSSSCSYQENKT